ncbi:MAG: hypothetical protein GY807_13370 [Gammaproteobacteria bacterium]|nr:hypothetical protein [Gammaproteobacteria bacterium]
MNTWKYDIFALTRTMMLFVLIVGGCTIAPQTLSEAEREKAVQGTKFSADSQQVKIPSPETISQIKWDANNQQRWPLGKAKHQPWDILPEEIIKKATRSGCCNKAIYAQDAAFSPDGRYILFGIGWYKKVWLGGTETYGAAFLWDLTIGVLIHSWEYDHDVDQVAFSPDGRHVLLANFRDMHLRNTKTGALIRSFDTRKIGDVKKIVFSPDGRFIAITKGLSPNGYGASLLNASTGSVIYEWRHSNREVNAVTFSPDGRYVLSAGTDAQLRKASTGELLHTWKPHKYDYNSVSAISFSPDTRYALTGSNDETARLWKVSTGELVYAWKHDDNINVVAFSPDGRYAASGSVDETVRLWDINTGNLVHKWNHNEANERYKNAGSIQDLAFSPDGHYLLIGTKRNGTFLRKVDNGDLVEKWGSSRLVMFSPDGRWTLLNSWKSSKLLLVQVPPLKKGFELLQEVVSAHSAEALKRYRHISPELEKQHKQLEKTKPVLPKLVKDKYESTANFKLRAANAKKEYADQVSAYNRRVEDLEGRIRHFYTTHKALPKRERNQIIKQAFLEVFGRPRIGNIRYDADTQMFFMDLSSDSPVANDFKRTLVLGPIPNQRAKAFEAELRRATPEVTFGLDDDGPLRWQEAKTSVNNTLHSLAPTDLKFKPVSMEVNIAADNVERLDLSQLRISDDGGIVNVDLAEDAEIARLQRQLYELRKAKAQTEAMQREKARLKAELARLRAAPVMGLSTTAKTLMQGLPKAKIKKPNAIAVIIGNRNYSTYQHGVPEVLYAHNDIELLKTFLIQSRGYREGNIIVLKDATLAQMRRTFGTLGNPKGRLFDLLRIKDTDVFIYYSGHGVPGLGNQKAYLLPVDGNPDKAEFNGYALDLLYANLAKLPARSVTVAIDACFSGSSQGGMLVQNASPALLRIRQGQSVPRNMVIMAAADRREVASWDKESRLGLFTRFLIEGVGGRADTLPNGNNDGQVSLQELQKFVQQEVTYEARRRYGREQNPQFTGQLNNIMSLVR